jgi:hypothetical protein
MTSQSGDLREKVEDKPKYLSKRSKPLLNLFISPYRHFCTLCAKIYLWRTPCAFWQWWNCHRPPDPYTVGKLRLSSFHRYNNIGMVPVPVFKLKRFKVRHRSSVFLLIMTKFHPSKKNSEQKNSYEVSYEMSFVGVVFLLPPFSPSREFSSLGVFGSEKVCTSNVGIGLYEKIHVICQRISVRRPSPVTQKT